MTIEVDLFGKVERDNLKEYDLDVVSIFNSL